LPAGRFSKVRVEPVAFGQPIRAGSRIRLTVAATGGARPLWAFDTIAHGEKVTIATDKAHPSRLVPARRVRSEGAGRVRALQVAAQPALSDVSEVGGAACLEAGAEELGRPDGGVDP
jgi:hypothetical protein